MVRRFDLVVAYRVSEKWFQFLGGDWHRCYASRGFGDSLAVGEESFNVEGDAFTDELLCGIVGWPSDTESGKVGRVRAPAGGRFLEDDGVFLHGLRSAWLKMLLRVPSSTSTSVPGEGDVYVHRDQPDEGESDDQTETGERPPEPVIECPDKCK